MKKYIFLFLTTLFYCSSSAFSQIQMLKQQNMKKWHIPAADYSGITPLGNNRYAVVSDSHPSDGFYEFLIEQDSISGKVKNVELIGIHDYGLEPRDAEAIAYFPPKNSVFIAAEDDQRIIEYPLYDSRKDIELEVPEMFGTANITKNRGFESLTYCDETALFWTCTESFLKSDATDEMRNGGKQMIRLQSFGTDLRPVGQHIYETDAPIAKDKVKNMAFGVSELTVLGDGTLLVLERQLLVKTGYIGSFAVNKIYRVKPGTAGKTLMAEWKTKLNLTRRNIANYEGMCLGARLSDGRQTILLVSDSQSGHGNSLFRLKDYIKVGICNFDI
jgi:hypothetical protein